MDVDRESWSLLMALQVTRGVDFWENQNTLAEYMLKTQVALSSRDPAAMRKRLEDAGLEPTEANMDIMRGMMDDPDSYRFKMHPAHVLKAAVDRFRDHSIPGPPALESRNPRGALADDM